MVERRAGPKRSRNLSITSGGLALALVVSSGAALADPATAEALFRDGRRLLDEGRYDEACTKLAESQAQDPASGTLINLALCYERQGKIATAWAHYRSAAVLARKDGRADRVATAEQKTTELESRVPHLVVHALRPLPDMEAHWASVHIGSGAFDTPIPVDPGTYVISVSAPGHVDFSATLELAEKESRTLEVPALVKASPASVPSAPAKEATSPPPAPSAAPAHHEGEANSTRTLGFVVGGAGLVSLGIGAYFGFSSLSAYSEADDACPSHHGCSEDVRDTRDEAQTKAWISNVALGAGVVATGIGAWLVFGAPGGKTEAVIRVTPLPRGAAVALRASL